MQYIIIFLSFCLGYAYARHSYRAHFYTQPSGFKRARIRQRAREAQAHVERIQAIREGKTPPVEWYEHKIQDYTATQYAELIRDTYELYGQSILADMVWSAFQAQRLKFEVTGQEGNVVYFSHD